MDYEKKHPILQKLEEYFKNTPKEQIEKDWSDILRETDPESYYEKKYKQALERAKKEWVENLDNCYTNYRERLEIIFPELSEGEDERIRKAILELVKQSSEILSKQNQNNMIAWLEKQGDINETSAEWSEEDEKKRKCLIKGLEDRMGFGWASDPFSREEYIDWLKSLRPQKQWKPSEAQLIVIKDLIEDKNTSKVNKTILRGMFDEIKQFLSPNSNTEANKL